MKPDSYYTQKANFQVNCLSMQKKHMGEHLHGFGYGKIFEEEMKCTK